MQILSNATKGLVLGLAESAKGAPVALSKGPFSVVVADPNNVATRVAGSPDQTTPDIFRANGTGNVGTVTITVTDTGQTPPLAAAPVSFDVVAPPPPPVTPDTLIATLTPEP